MKFLMGKSRMIASTAVLAALMLVLALAAPPAVSTAAAETEQPVKRTLSVSAQGTVTASPDIAYVTMGVVTENSDAKTAQQENAKKMDAVVKVVKGAGIESKDIKTTGYYINPKYSYEKETGTSSITGYTVSNSVQVTVRDIEKVGSVLDLAADNGANSSSSISFGLSDYEKVYNQALKTAVENAKTRAKTMADALDIKLDVPVSVSESGGYYAPQYSYSYDAVKASTAGRAETPVSAGSLEVKASVSLTYQY